VPKRLATYGRRGALVRVLETERSGVRRYVVQWGSKADRQQRSFDGSRAGRAEALAFAEAFSAEAQRPAVMTEATTRQLWEAYTLAAWPTLRARSRALYAEQWRKWEQWFGRDRVASAFRLTDAHAFRAELERQGLATKTVHAIVTMVRMVYRFGEAHELVTNNRWHLYTFKVAKERRTQPRAEYREEEFIKIWAQLDPTNSGQWRAYCAIGLLGLYGMRENALLHLAWPDVGDTAFTLRAEWDKVGKQHVHTITPEAAAVFAIARAWRDRIDPAGVWVFPPARKGSRSATYTIQSLWSALQAAEQRAGVPKIRWRAGHGFRRGLVGDLLAGGADVELALKAIGDSDLRMAQHYAVRRNERIDAALAVRSARMGQNEGATKGQPTPETTNATPLDRETPRSVTSTKTRTSDD
jgi:integrase